MKKLNLIKKMMLVLATSFVATSLFFVSTNLNNKVKLNKKRINAENVVLQNKVRDVKYICKPMKQNENWLEIVDIKRISGSEDKFNEIDLTDLTLEDGSSNVYDIKSIKIFPDNCYFIFDKINFQYVNLGDWKLINLSPGFLDGINLPSKDLNINIAKEAFEPSLLAKGLVYTLTNSVFRNVYINIENNEKYSQTDLLRFTSLKADKIIINGDKMSLVSHANNLYGSGSFLNLRVDQIIFNNEITGLSLALFDNIKARTSNERTKVIFKKPSENFFISSKHHEKTTHSSFVLNSEIDFIIDNNTTRIDLLSEKINNNSLDDRTFEWFWALNDTSGDNKSTIFINKATYDAIQANPELNVKWDKAKIAGELRKRIGNNTPWYQVIENNVEPTSIKSTLVVPETTKVSVNETIEFNLTFTGESGYLIDHEKIKLYEKTIDGENDQLIDEQNYSIVILNDDKNLNHKVAKITFFKTNIYKKLVLNYEIGQNKILRDLSEGIDLEVINEKITMTLSSDFDFNKKLSQGDSIIFKLEATKDIEWKNRWTGVKFILKDDKNKKINLNDYFYFEWIHGFINKDKAQFKITSKEKQTEEITLNLNVVKIDDSSIETNSQNIKLLKELEPEDQGSGSTNSAILGAGVSTAVLGAIGPIGAIISRRRSKIRDKEED